MTTSADQILLEVREPRYTVARLFGVHAAKRRDVLRGMLDKPADEHALYWLELLLSTGIATFGLVLNSTGVVIGAMLIAPLMTPIVELSMSLVATSSYLLVKSLSRVVASVLLVLLGSALITLVLPFREATPEILARTSPTLLDLFVAVCCAIAGAATTARPHSGATSTAAGTAIGISLVPPLCAAGFGLGSGNRPVAEGAFLLFTANFSAILVFAALTFWLLDFGGPERESTSQRQAAGPIDAIHLRLARLLESRLDKRSRTLARIAVPVALLLVIIHPLTIALAEVTAEVRARTALSQVVAREPLLKDAIRLEPQVDRGALDVRAVVVCSDKDAAALQRRVTTALAEATGVRPFVHVRAVEQARVPEVVHESPAARAALAPEPVTPAEAARTLGGAVATALGEHLPPDAPVLDSRLDVGAQGQLRLMMAFAGPALDARAAGILGRALAGPLGTSVDVSSIGLPASPVEAPIGKGAAWLELVEPAILDARAMPNVAICLSLPDEAQLRRHRADANARARVLVRIAGLSPTRLVVASDRTWRARFAATSCTPPASFSAARATPGDRPADATGR